MQRDKEKKRKKKKKREKERGREKITAAKCHACSHSWSYALFLLTSIRSSPGPGSGVLAGPTSTCFPTAGSHAAVF